MNYVKPQGPLRFRPGFYNKKQVGLLFTLEGGDDPLQGYNPVICYVSLMFRCYRFYRMQACHDINIFKC